MPFPVVETAPGCTRQVLADAPELMVVAFGFAEGGVGARHNHPQVQATYCESGRFRFFVGAAHFVIGPGNAFVIPSLAWHGCTCLEAGRLIDTFTPRRDDFL